ncbi:DoxX family protein [Robiginitalea sp. IMCC43444]|uniref:DoxX family protein n=1 Tax=Robiginitalea sp. IMCC43444 TaxID=3459121 RepID=UPI0040430115
MEYLILAAKIIIFISIVNVWLIRFNRPTAWRGANAASMKEEFAAYGLSEAMMYMVGALKLICAISLMVSIYIPFLAIPASAGMGFLMFGAVWMHFRVKDPLKKSLPAFIFLLLSALIWLEATGTI